MPRDPADSPPSRRRRAAALGVALAGLTLAGCGGGDDGSGATSAAGRSAPTAAAAEASAPSGDRSARWAGAGDDRDVVARRRVSGPLPEDAEPGARVTVDLLIRGLTVRGRTATLRFTAIPRGWGKPRDILGGPTLYELNPGPNTEFVSAQLIDVERLRRHLPLEDSDGEALASMNYAGNVSDGQPINASWVFAAPPPDVEAMDVQIGSWPIFREVPVTRR
jgi:hypothetical protein